MKTQVRSHTLKGLYTIVCCLAAALVASCAGGPAAPEAGPGVQAQASQEPNPSFAPDFKQYGLYVTKEPTLEGVDETEIGLASGRDIMLAAQLTDMKTGKPAGSADVEETGGRWKIHVVFPSSGDYELLVGGKPGSAQGDTYTVLARWVFHASVPEGTARYLLDTDKGTQEIKFENLQADQGEWRVARWSVPNHRNGTLGVDCQIRVGGQPVQIAKGSAVTVAVNNRHVIGFAFTLPRDLTLEESGGPATFSAGSKIVLGNWVIIGRLAKDTPFDLSGMELTSPKGSRVSIERGNMALVELAGDASLSAGGLSLVCTDTVYVGNLANGLNVYVTLSKETAFDTGKAKFTAPAGTAVDFAEGRISYVIFFKPASISSRGQVHGIEAGQGVRFDERGGFQEVFLPKGG